jgi:hypothetical protein
MRHIAAKHVLSVATFLRKTVLLKNSSVVPGAAYADADEMPRRLCCQGEGISGSPEDQTAQLPKKTGANKVMVQVVAAGIPGLKPMSMSNHDVSVHSSGNQERSWNKWGCEHIKVGDPSFISRNDAPRISA